MGNVDDMIRLLLAAAALWLLIALAAALVFGPILRGKQPPKD